MYSPHSKKPSRKIESKKKMNERYFNPSLYFFTKLALFNDAIRSAHLKLKIINIFLIN